MFCWSIGSVLCQSKVISYIVYYISLYTQWAIQKIYFLRFTFKISIILCFWYVNVSKKFWDEPKWVPIRNWINAVYGHINQITIIFAIYWWSKAIYQNKHCLNTWSTKIILLYSVFARWRLIENKLYLLYICIIVQLVDWCSSGSSRKSTHFWPDTNINLQLYLINIYKNNIILYQNELLVGIFYIAVKLLSNKKLRTIHDICIPVYHDYEKMLLVQHNYKN